MSQDQYNANQQFSHESGAFKRATSKCEGQAKVESNIEVLCTLERTQPGSILITDEHESNTSDSSVSHIEGFLNTAEDFLNAAEEVADTISEQNSPTAWIKAFVEPIVPILKQGGKPVAIILALGFTAVAIILASGFTAISPLLLGANLWIPLILVAILIVVIRVPL
jgi:hypothetical protein